jgi:tetratricopeptide (TPR) repeat protein
MRGMGWVLAVTLAAGGGLYLLLARRGQADERRLRADLALAIERGTLADLGRAQAVGRRLVLSHGRDRDTAAALAFADAMLAVDYGADTADEAERALTGADLRADDAVDAPGAMAIAARALIHLRGGDRAGALGTAAAAAARAPELPYPLYALARARARAGDLAGAERALDAAIVEAPGFMPARIAWAEARLDVGDLQSAQTGLAPALGRGPGEPRALLLLDQVAAALGQPPPPALEDVCRVMQRGPPLVAAGCALSRANRARRAGHRAAARTAAETAGRTAPHEPRLLAGAALTLAQLGAVDLAGGLLERAGRLAAPEMPALAWAHTAVVLGRGRAPAARDDARPTDPEARLLVARLALAGGGVTALEATLRGLGPAAVAGDADLQTLAGLTPHRGAELPRSEDPLGAYVAGLQADLASDPARAADFLAGALAGHGDACRAAGEYVGALRALKLRPRAELFGPLRGENAGCVNLPRRRAEVLGGLR